jgi:rhodanese-related sulfurtransferase
MRRALLILVAGFALLVVGCGSKAKTAQPRLVSPAEFAAAVAEPGTVTINVLGPGTESIPGTDLFISVDQLSASRGELPSPSTKLAVYCAHGNTSAVAVPILEQLGYENIVELDGGMAAWLASGRKLVAASG